MEGQTVLLTFWVSVPQKTEAREFFQFLQQQGYLRVWLDGEIVRADAEKKVRRLGARVQVIQDRITISAESRARLVESIETALRFGKDRINLVPFSSKRNQQSEIESLLHRLALRALRSRHPATDARAFQL